jgi:hypothetical protein
MIERISIVLFVAFALTTAQAADEQGKLQSSQKTWQRLKQKCGGNYSYKIRFSSFAGFGHESEIIVRNNKVVERRYRAFSNRPVLVQPGQKQPQGETWAEKGKDLGTHKKGAPPKTLDELYVQAGEVVKRKLPQHERRYVRFDKQGLLLSCFTVDTRIADDAPRKGVTISSITLGRAGGAKPGKVYKSPNGKAYPQHWGEPPRRQTRDLVPLPAGYGRGSGTIARWIRQNLERDEKAK